MTVAKGKFGSCQAGSSGDGEKWAGSRSIWVGQGAGVSMGRDEQVSAWAP